MPSYSACHDHPEPGQGRLVSRLVCRPTVDPRSGQAETMDCDYHGSCDGPFPGIHRVVVCARTAEHRPASIAPGSDSVAGNTGREIRTAYPTGIHGNDVKISATHPADAHG